MRRIFYGIMLVLLSSSMLLPSLEFGADFPISEEGYVKIIDFYSCDTRGILQDYFPIKTTACFNISIRNLGQVPRNISIYVSVHDELNVPIGIDRYDTIIPQNASAYYIMSVYIPKWAFVGFATAYASLLEEGISVGDKTTGFYIGPEDLMPPIIDIVSPENITYETEPIFLAFTINERTTWIGYSLNDVINVTVSGNTTLSDLDNGSHRIRVYAYDTSGNLGSSEDIYFNVSIMRDVAIIGVECSSKEVCAGEILDIAITVLNEGTMTETFNVSTYANSTVIGTLTVANLSRNNQENFVLFWNTTNINHGNYTIKAVASAVLRETDTADNTYVDGEVRIKEPPVACFTFSPTLPFSFEAISFNASLSTPEGGIMVSYEWNFGDGTSNATGVTASHVYSDNGTYAVTLVVTDSEELTDTDCQNITVLNQPPVANFSKTAETVFIDELVDFNASASYDLDGTITAYFWDFGDGTNAAGVTAVHGYEHNGTYEITLTVTDDDDASGSTSVIKNVLSRPDVAVSNATASKTVVGQGYSLDMNLVLTNKGERVETSDVTIFVGAASIATQKITLTNGKSTVVIFTWNTANFSTGNYTLTAYAWPIQGEIFTSDNEVSVGIVFVTIPGDINGDSYANAKDAICLGAAFCGFGESNPNADINGDGYVNAKDAVILGIHFNE
jgi:PKD repeat protein